jgi:hypothetical protein
MANRSSVIPTPCSCAAPWADTALQALAVDEETIHVADDGGGDAIDHPSGLRMGSSTTVGEA